MAVTALEQVRSLSQGLTNHEKLQFINDLVHQLLQEAPSPEKQPFRSLWDALAHLGPAPSAEDIDEARREACADFPREDI